jgi:hypothetical protein
MYKPTRKLLCFQTTSFTFILQGALAAPGPQQVKRRVLNFCQKFADLATSTGLFYATLRLMK